MESPAIEFSWHANIRPIFSQQPSAVRIQSSASFCWVQSTVFWMSGVGGFRGVSADQDVRYVNKTKKVRHVMCAMRASHMGLPAVHHVHAPAGPDQGCHLRRPPAGDARPACGVQPTGRYQGSSSSSIVGKFGTKPRGREPDTGGCWTPLYAQAMASMKFPKELDVKVDVKALRSKAASWLVIKVRCSGMPCSMRAGR